MAKTKTKVEATKAKSTKVATTAAKTSPSAADFKDSIKKGLAAAHAMETARAEIDEVLRAASEEVGGYFGVKLEFYFGEKELNTRRQNMTELVTGTPAPTRTVDVLFVRGPGGRAQLATVEFGELTLPLTLDYGRHAFVANDLKGFELALTRAIESPLNAAKIATVAGPRP